MIQYLVEFGPNEAWSSLTRASVGPMSECFSIARQRDHRIRRIGTMRWQYIEREVCAVDKLAIFGCIVMARRIMFLSTATVEQKDLTCGHAPGYDKARCRQHQFEIVAFYRQRAFRRCPKRILVVKCQSEQPMTTPIGRTR